MLVIKNLKVSIEGPSFAKASEGKKEILKGIDLEVKPGEIHVLMGPNGSGKSTLAQVIMGHPSYSIVNGRLSMGNRDIRKLTPDKRAKLGIFLAFQHPVEIPGVSVFNVLRRAKQSSLSARHSGDTEQSEMDSRIDSGQARMTKRKNDNVGAAQFRQELLEYALSLKLSDDFLSRSLNAGFSGGEKKRSEILQMMALKPKLAILDEIDSGLDVDGLQLVADAVKRFTMNNKRSSVLLITHYARILKYLKPDFVHIMIDGKIIKSGSMRLARQIEEKGYQSFALSS